MTKVRSQERQKKRLTNQRLYVALKNVARIQDQQQIEDSENVPVVAPSLRRHDTPAYPPARVVPSMADKDNNTNVVGETEKASPGPRDESLEEVDRLAGDGETEACTEPDDNEWFDNMSEEDNMPAEVIAVAAEERPKKKKKGEGMRTVVESLRKNLRPVGEISKLKMNLVTMAPPPIPTPKGRARAMYVFYYLTTTVQ